MPTPVQPMLCPAQPGSMVRLLACLKDEQEKILIPGWYDEALPPTDLDLAYLAALPNDEEFFKKELGLTEFLLGKTGLELDKAVFNPTCNIQGITTGYQGPGLKTIIPANASAKLDFRLVPGQNPDDLFLKLRQHLDRNGFADAVLVKDGSMHPYKSGADDPFIQLAQRLAPEVYGYPLVINPLAGGSSPIYAFAGPLGDIPVLWAGVGGPNTRAHSPDENIEIKNFLNGARFIARILNKFDSIISIN